MLDRDPVTGGVTTVAVDMGIATFAPRERLTVDGVDSAVTILSVGNPHCVVFVPDLAAVDLHALGPAIETHPTFPERTNVQFATPIDAGLVAAPILGARSRRDAGVRLQRHRRRCRRAPPRPRRAGRDGRHARWRVAHPN